MLIICPSCQRQLRVPDEAAGNQVKCPSCQTVFASTSAATGEEIQAPPAPLPARAAEEEPRSRRGYDQIERGNVDLRDHQQAQRLASNAAIWFFVAAMATLIIAATNMVMMVALDEAEDILLDVAPGDDEAMLGAMVCGLGCCGSFILAVAVTMVIAGLQMRSFASKGWVITGIVEAFAVALVFGGGTFLNAIHMLMDTADALDHWIPVRMLCGVLAAILNSVAGVKAIMALNDPAVSAEFDRNRSHRRRRIRWEE